MTRGRIFPVMLLIAAYAHTAYSQSAPVKGVVWDAPAPPVAADLLKIHEAGVEAVRLPLLADLSLIRVADSLGMQLFQDLPVPFLPAPSLRDTLAYAKRHLSHARYIHRMYPSVHHFGIATKSDTSDPRACEYFRELSAWAPELTLYYISAFVAHDQCSSHVDMVLVDTRRKADPVTVMEGWTSATPVGFASLGKRVDPGTSGLYQEDSPESQARFLENYLPELLAQTYEAIFVYRWQDPADALSEWGLIDATGQARPAHDVLRGIYTEHQSVFAFSQGERLREDPPWPLLMGWVTCLLIIFLSLWYRKFPEVMWNYIMNMYPHRDTLYRESALLGGASFFYVIAQGLLIAATVLILIEAYRDIGMLESVAILLPPYAIERIQNLTSNPFLPTLVVIAIYLTVILVSSLLGAWDARQPGREVPVEHFFVVNAMNNTPLLMMLPLVLVTPGLHERQSDIMALILAAAWILLSVYCTYRRAQNFLSLSRGSLAKSATFGLSILPPLLLFLGVILVLSVPHTREYIVFWWNLSFKT